MLQIALSILALAAGVHLLIKTKEAGLGFIYKSLSWLVVLLALGFMLCGVVRHHRMHGHHCEMSGKCDMGRGEGACPYMKGGSDCSMHGNSCCMHGDKGQCSEGMSGCTKGEIPACCSKGGEEGKAACCGKEAKAPCCDKGAEKPMPACCAKGAKADSTAKK